MPLDPASICLWGAALVWLGLALEALSDVLAVRSLPGVASGSDRSATRPSVSVVVPARDEAARIETTVRRLLAQEGVDIEVIVVDDRSSDGTGAILDRVAREDARLRVIHLRELPAGWLGKPHACQRGGEVARGEWILFTDGDAWMEPDVIARAIAAGERETADHVVLAPGFGRATLAARAALCAFALSMSGYMARANRDRPGGFVGFGAFNLVRAERWRAIDGH